MRYRWWIGVAGILAFALTGAWLGHVLHVTPSWTAMMPAATLLGAVAVVAFLRTMGRSSSSHGSSGSTRSHGS